MSARSTSIARRVAWAAFASAGIAAAVAAMAASAFAELLMTRQTDRHLVAVASELVRDLSTVSAVDAIEQVVRDEQDEVTSTGVRLAVYGSAGSALAGDTNVPFIDSDTCSTVREVRICGVHASGGKYVMAGMRRETTHGLLAVAALGAALIAGCVAWGIARVLSRRAVGPLIRLQRRIVKISPQGPRPALLAGDLGADEGVAEVDELRRALDTLLKRMSDAIGRSSNFAANAAHELRTPLTALRAELELMTEGSASDAGASLASLDLALRKVTQLQALTERLLVLARPEDREEERFEILSLRDVVDETMTTLTLADAARVFLGDEEVDVFVRGDALALRMVVSNGLSNALKFGKHVRIELGVADGLAILAIEDDGPGVPAGERARMFEPFARADSASRVPGHGLGLALVADVAQRHRGRAQLTAALHSASGARLEIHLPCASEAPPSSPIQQPTPGSQNT